MKTRIRIGMMLAALSLGGIPLITTATCSPRSGFVEFFRDDDFGQYACGGYDPFGHDCGYGGYYYDDSYYFDDGYYYEEIIFFD